MMYYDLNRNAGIITPNKSIFLKPAIRTPDAEETITAIKVIQL